MNAEGLDRASLSLMLARLLESAWMMYHLVGTGKLHSGKPMIEHDLSACAADLLAARTKADLTCWDQMVDLQLRAREAVAALRVIHKAQAQGYGLDPGAWAALAAFQRRENFCRQYFTVYAVRWAVLTGRWPEPDEGEAWTRCADDDGLMGFLDEMRRVPIGFVDPPIAPPTRN